MTTTTMTPTDIRDRALLAPPAPSDERAARRTLLRQVARLEDRLAAAFVESPAAIPQRMSRRGARLLSLGEIERVRDALVERLDEIRRAEIASEEDHAAARATLETMYADPCAHKWARITRAQLGLPGCGHYHVRPRLGIVGMLRGWWVVKVSSGCPLATSHPVAAPAVTPGAASPARGAPW